MANKSTSSLHATALRTTRISFYFAALFMAVIVVSDAWNLITPEIVIQRWTLAAGMLAVTAACWYIIKTAGSASTRVKLALWTQVVMYLVVATLTVYAQRGIASRGVILYAIPLIISAALLSRAAIYATAATSVALYSLTVIRYFYLNYGEAYKVELYGELLFYAGILVIIAAFLVNSLRAKDER